MPNEVDELKLFARIGDTALQAWIDKERTLAVRYLSESVDLVRIHRAQGQLALLNRMQALIEKAKNT